MVKDLEAVKESLGQIASRARAIKDPLIPVEWKIRETSVELPKTVILSRLYDELLMIQRILMIKSLKEDDSALTSMQGRAIFPFATALYIPVKEKDFPFTYDDFYRTHFGFSYESSWGRTSSLDLLLQGQGMLINPRVKQKLPSRFVIEDSIRNTELDREKVVVDEKLLRDLQYFYNLDVSAFFNDYILLLKKIREELGEFAEFDINNLEERTIPTTLGNIPLKIFRDEDLIPGYRDEERRIVQDMTVSNDWGQSLDTILEFIGDVKNPSKGNLRRYRVLSTGHFFNPVELSPAPNRDEIIGVDDNLKRLEALIRGYVRGKSTPNIVLLGPGGVGKTMSLRYVIDATSDLGNLRYFLMDSLEDIKQLVQLSDGYKPIGIIDDMRGEVNQSVYSHLKQQLEGLGDTFFDRALIIISANPEIWSSLDDAVKQRLGGVELKYEPNPRYYDQLVRQFCGKFGVAYEPSIVENVRDMVPRQIRDHIRALGSEQIVN